MTVRRLLWVVPLMVVALAVAYTGWLAWQIQGELEGAESSAIDLQEALTGQDAQAREQASVALEEDARQARQHTDGAWWGALTHLPLVGDDAGGVRAMSASLDMIASDAVDPLGETVDRLGTVSQGGRIDLDVVDQLGVPVREAHTALQAADDELAGRDSDHYVDALRTRFDRYADLVHGLRSGLGSAETAVDVLPTMVGADGPRDYLLIFQNNAEIRATGGMPGSWALLHAEDGKIEITKQGTASDFPTQKDPILPLSDSENAVYGPELGRYFQDPGFTPDFPRAAELWRAHWSSRFPETDLDGVVALDPIGMSYLLDGTGPVTVGDVTLTRDTVVPALLNTPYIELGTDAQDQLFQVAAREIFTAATGDLASPVAFVQGLGRAADEGRFLVASFDDDVRRELGGTQVEGALAGDDGSTPHVDIGLNDLTGSKMSYYLRYNASVDATSCGDGVQELAGSLGLRQVIAPSEAAALPVSVTGGGNYGTEPGSQYVMVRIYGPYGGTVDDLRLDGRALPRVEVVELDGRPVASVDVLLSNRKDVRLTWRSTTGAGQVGSGVVGTTPSIAPGSDRAAFATAC